MVVRSLRDTLPLRLLRGLTRATRLQHDEDVAELNRRGLQPGEFDVIATLGNTEGLTMGLIARRMLSSPPNVTRLVKALESKGLVRRARAPGNDREVIARLTEAGERVFEEEYPTQVAFLDQWFSARLCPEEQEQLATLLERLVEGKR